MYNNWIALEQTKFAEWEITFPAPADSGESQNIRNFAAGLLQAGNEENVYVIKDTARIIDLWDTCWEKSGMMPLFDLRKDETWGWIADTGAIICYFDEEGNTRETMAQNIGQFLKSIEHRQTNTTLSYMEDVAPLTILSNSMSKTPSTKPVVFTISLRTDIWFPRVLSLAHHRQPYSPAPRQWHDNASLASCHTPRLNRFLSKAHSKAITNGGTWKQIQAEGIAEHYQAMTGVDSILI